MLNRTAKRPGGSGADSGLRDRPAHRDLALALRPHDGVDRRLDDATRIGLERDLRLVAGRHLMQLVLVKEGDDLELVLDEGQHRLEAERGGELARAQLQVDDRAVGRRIEDGLTELPLRSGELSLDLRDFRLIVAHGGAQAGANLRLRCDVRVELRFELLHLRFRFLQGKAISGAGRPTVHGSAPRAWRASSSFARTEPSD